MTRPSTDHVVIHDEVDGMFELKCEHCADFHHPRLPITAALLADRLLGFVRMHRLCPKPVAPSPQLALPGTEQKPAKCCGSRERCINCPIPIDVFERFPAALPNELERHAIDASTDEPAPEIDPPGPYARFDELYPLATNPLQLLVQLIDFMPEEQHRVLRDNVSWHPASGIFNAVANWARIEKAHAEAGTREPIAGLTIPRREPMPQALAELLGVKP